MPKTYLNETDIAVRRLLDTGHGGYGYGYGGWDSGCCQQYASIRNAQLEDLKAEIRANAIAASRACEMPKFPKAEFAEFMRPAMNAKGSISVNICEYFDIKIGSKDCLACVYHDDESDFSNCLKYDLLVDIQIKI